MSDSASENVRRAADRAKQAAAEQRDKMEQAADSRIEEADRRWEEAAQKTQQAANQIAEDDRKAEAVVEKDAEKIRERIGRGLRDGPGKSA